MLRKGPEHVPDSIIVLFVALLLLAISTFCSAVLTAGGTDTALPSLTASFAGYGLYIAVLGVSGFVRRSVPTIACIMACGSLLSILTVAAFVLLNPFLGATIASIVAWLILIWSVPVKGHIIARAIERHWYFGVAIALAIFIMQYLLYLELTRGD